MIASTHRFHGPNSLRFVYKSGRSVRGPLFAVKVASNHQRQSYRVAVVVSRKVHKSAVARNRMRRRLYAAVRGVSREITQPYDIVLTVYSDAVLNEPAAGLAGQVKRQLASAGVFG